MAEDPWTRWHAGNGTTESPLAEPGSTAIASGEPVQLTNLPAIVAVALLAFSAALLFVHFGGLASSVLGYVCTPLLAVGCVAWSTGKDSALRLNVWYDRKVSKLFMIRALGAASFVVGFAHMWVIATYVGRLFAGGLQ